MALANYNHQPAETNDGIVLARNTNVEKVRVGDEEAGRIKQQVITGKVIGTWTAVRNTRYAKSNFYIKQTRPYIPSRKLRTYIDFPGFTKLVHVAFCLLALELVGIGGTLFILKPYVIMPASAVALLFGAVLFAVFCQHLHVIRTTIPWILRLPAIPMPNENAHFEIAVTELEGVYLSAHNAGVGAVTKSTGKVKIHVLSMDSVEKIKMGVRWSIVHLILSALGGLTAAGFLVFGLYWWTNRSINSCILETSTNATVPAMWPCLPFTQV